jgi:hypothetical protein
MTQVFVSYAHKDYNLALPVMEAIHRAGLMLRDAGALLPGEPFAEGLQREIEAAQCVVVLWSEAAAQSRFVQLEIHQAIRAWSSDRLVLATLDDTPLPVGLRDLQAISIRDATDSDRKKLIERAQEILDRQAILSPPIVELDERARDARVRLEQIERRESYPAPSARPLRSRWIVLFALFTLFVALIGAAFLYTWSAPQVATDAARLRPPPIASPLPGPVEKSAPLAFILILVVLGAVIGAGAVWVRTAWSRRRSNRPPSSVLSPQVPVESNSAAQVFVSYSRQDGPTVEQLVQQIEELGYAVWIDRQSTGVQRYAGPIVRAIRRSRVVALMCSQNAFVSDHVIREVYFAGDCKKPFIIFQLDSTGFPDEILYFVSGFPRVPVATIDPQQLRSQIAQLVAA